MLIPSSMRYIQKNIHVNIYVAVNLMIGGPIFQVQVECVSMICNHMKLISVISNAKVKWD